MIPSNINLNMYNRGSGKEMMRYLALYCFLVFFAANLANAQTGIICLDDLTLKDDTISRIRMMIVISFLIYMALYDLS